MSAQEKAAGMLAAPATAHTNDCTANSTAQKIGNPSLHSAGRERALSALHFIPPDLSHDEWVRVVMGAQAEGLSFEDVDTWSSTGDTYTQQAMRSTWCSAKPGKGIGPGTLYYMAKKHGWPGGINDTALAKPMKAAPRASKPHVPPESPNEILARCVPATHKHPYIVEKGAHGVPLDDLKVVPEGDPLHIMGESMVGALVLSVLDADGALLTLQFIPRPEVVERMKAQGKLGKLNLPGFHLGDGWFTVPAQTPGDTPIYVCEGIGAAWSCWKATGAMAVATCGSGRVRKVATQLRQQYAHTELVLVADVGKEQACDAIARAVRARVVCMPEGWSNNSDVNDYALREGHDALAELLESVRDPAPAQSADDGVVLTRASGIKPEPIAWLWPGWLAQGKVQLLAGPPGQGKTTLAMAMSTTVSCGGCWPDGTQCSPGNVLIWSGEDDPADTLVPRLMGMGANLENVHFVDGTRINGELAPFDPARDMQGLAAAANQLGNVRLIVVDPIVSAIAGDSHKNAEVRRGMQPLVDMASALGAAVLGITHLPKGTEGRDPTERVIGSIAFSAVARIVMLVAKVKGEDGQGKRILVRSKSNIGPDSGGFEYHVEQVEPKPGLHTSIVTWGEAVDGTARELLAEAEDEPDTNKTATDEAMECLIRILGRDTVPSHAATAQMKAEGYSPKMIRTARERLGIIPKRSGFGKEIVSYWKLPDPSLVPLDAIDAHSCPVPGEGINGHEWESTASMGDEAEESEARP